MTFLLIIDKKNYSKDTNGFELLDIARQQVGYFNHSLLNNDPFTLYASEFSCFELSEKEARESKRFEKNSTFKISLKEENISKYTFISFFEIRDKETQALISVRSEIKFDVDLFKKDWILKGYPDKM